MQSSFRPTLLVFLPLLLAAHIGASQEQAKKTYFSNLSLDPDGHICYTESLDQNPLNRIEYRTNGKYVLDIYYTAGPKWTKVEITDFDSDSKADLIFIEKDHGERDVEKVSFFRGPEYLEHLKRHLGHALRTATHPLIKDQPEEKERARKIEEELKVLDRMSIQREETGVYSADGLFESARHKDIQYAFTASDTLYAALDFIMAGDFRVLSQEPEIAKKYSLEINILMNIDPADHERKEK